MKRSTTRWTTAFAATALLGLPAAGWAQTGSAAQQPPAATAPAAAQNDAAQEHLKKAKVALDEIAPTAVTGRAKTQLTELKRHLAALERASAANTTASAQRSTTATKSRANASWGTEVAAVDKILAQMLGSASGTGTAGTTGTTGTATPKAGAAAATLDDATRAKLTEVREHITKFAAAMSGTASTPRTDDAATTSAAGSTTGTTSSTAGTSATGTSATGSTTGSTAATGSTTAQPPATGTETPQTTPQAQVDTDAARRHLTEARDTLSQLTQLPAAATLTGDARTQVAQLISNFNELITTQADWRASYGKVAANLNALLGPEDAAAAAATTTTPPTTATGTAGAVGTSGTTAAATLDPAVRTKLMELRAKLNEFERAAGGVSTTANPASGTTSGVTTGSASSVTSGTTTSGTTAATGSTTGTSATGSTAAAGSTATTEPQQQPATGAMSNADAMRHIQAIEAILKLDASSTPATAGTTGTAGATGTSGSANASVTLTKAQLDELRTHLNELKKSIEKK